MKQSQKVVDKLKRQYPAIIKFLDIGNLGWNQNPAKDEIYIETAEAHPTFLMHQPYFSDRRVILVT